MRFNSDHKPFTDGPLHWQSQQFTPTESSKLLQLLFNDFTPTKAPLNADSDMRYTLKLRVPDVKRCVPILSDTQRQQLKDFKEDLAWLLEQCIVDHADQEPISTASFPDLKILTKEGLVFAKSFLDGLRKLALINALLDQQAEVFQNWSSPFELLTRLCDEVGVSSPARNQANAPHLHVPGLNLIHPGATFIHADIATEVCNYIAENAPELLFYHQVFISDPSGRGSYQLTQFIDRACHQTEPLITTSSFNLIPTEQPHSEKSTGKVVFIKTLMDRPLDGIYGNAILSPSTMFEALNPDTAALVDAPLRAQEILKVFDSNVTQVNSHFIAIALEYCYFHEIPMMEIADTDRNKDFLTKFSLGRNRRQILFTHFYDFLEHINRFQSWVESERSKFIAQHGVGTQYSFSWSDYKDFEKYVALVLRPEAHERFQQSMFIDRHLDTLSYLSTRDAKIMLSNFKKYTPKIDCSDPHQTDHITIFSSDRRKRVFLSQLLALSKRSDDSVLLKLPNRGTLEPSQVFRERIIVVNLDGLDRRILSHEHHVGVITEYVWGAPTKHMEVMVHNSFSIQPNPNLVAIRTKIEKALEPLIVSEVAIETDSLSDIVIVDEQGDVLFEGLNEYLEFQSIAQRLVGKNYKALEEKISATERSPYYLGDATPMILLYLMGENAGHASGIRSDRLPTCPTTGRTADFHFSRFDGYVTPDHIPDEILEMALDKLTEYINRTIGTSVRDVVCCDSTGNIFLSVDDIDVILKNRSRRIARGHLIAEFATPGRSVRHTERVLTIPEISRLLGTHLPSSQEILEALQLTKKTDLDQHNRILKAFLFHAQSIEVRFHEIARHYQQTNFIPRWGFAYLSAAMRGYSYEISFENISQLAHCYLTVINHLNDVADSIGAPFQKMRETFPERLTSIPDALAAFAQYPSGQYSQTAKNQNQQVMPGFVAVGSNTPPEAMTPHDAIDCIAQIAMQVCIPTLKAGQTRSSVFIAMLKGKKVSLVGENQIHETTFSFLLTKSGFNESSVLLAAERMLLSAPSRLFVLQDRALVPGEKYVVCPSLSILRLGIEANASLLITYHEQFKKLTRLTHTIPASLNVDNHFWLDMIWDEWSQIQKVFREAFSQYAFNEMYSSDDALPMHLNPDLKVCDEEGRVIFENFLQLVSSYKRFHDTIEQIHVMFYKALGENDDALTLTPSIAFADLIEDFGYRPAVAPEHFTFDYQLASLPSNKSGITSKIASTVLDEASLGVFGDASQESRSKLGDYTFTDTAFTYVIPGSELIQKAAEAQSEPEPETAVEVAVENLLRIHQKYGLAPSTLYLALVSMGLYGTQQSEVDRFLESISESSPRARREEAVTFEEVFLSLSDFLYVPHAPATEGYSVKAIADLLKIIALKTHHHNISDAISLLQSLPGHNIHPALHAALADTIEQLEMIKVFKEPETVRVTLCPLQREAVIGAHTQTNPLFIGGPGVGKTEVGACFAEYEKVERTLYITKTSNRSGVQKRLRESILTDPSGVELLTKDHWKMTSGEFQTFLQGVRYLVAGADTVALLKSNAPDNFIVLKEWLKERRSARILDEVHVLDNHKTARFKACYELQATVQISMTGTPTQHSLTKLPTIFKISLPEALQPNEAAYQRMRRDPRAGVHLLRSVSTIFNIEDMADFFVHPDLVPYAQQLETGPKIPRVNHRTLDAPLSLQQSLTLLDLTNNYSAWAEAHQRSSDPLVRIWALHQLIANPQKLGVTDHNSVLDAVLEECRRSVMNGERTLVYAEHVYPLHELYRALRAEKIGAYLLDGTVTPEEREKSFSALENDPEHFIGLAQCDASGGGFNNRKIDKIILLELPKTTGGHIQIFGRGQRPIFSGQEAFGRESIEIVTVVPRFHPDLARHLEKMNLPTEGVSAETIYARWHERRNHALRRYRIATTRELTENDSVFDAWQRIDEAVARVQTALQQTFLYSQALIAEHARRNQSGKKEEWRSGFVFKNLEQVLDGPLPPPQMAKALIMAGVEGHEVPLLLGAGFSPENIIAIDNALEPELQLATHQALSRHGVVYRVASVEQALRTNERYDFISIDPYGPLTLDWIRTLQFAQFHTLALSMNALQGREDASTVKVYRSLPKQREDLMTLALKLCGTQKTFDQWSEGYAGNVVEQIAYLYQRFAPVAAVLEGVLAYEASIISDFLLEFALQAPHLSFVREYNYKSDKGRPFKGRFAVLNQWREELIASDSASILTELLASSLEGSSVKIAVGEDMVAIMVDRVVYSLSIDALTELFTYWKTQVTPGFGFSGMGLESIALTLQSHYEQQT